MVDARMPHERRPSTVHIGCQPQNLSFSGCGFLGVYHIGVASCIKQHAPNFLNGLQRIYGCSAGSIIGAMLLSDVCNGELCRSTMDIVRNVRSRFLGPLSPGFSPTRLLLQGFRKILPPDAHVKCNGRLHVSLTRVSDMKNVIVSEFSTRDELINALLCSSFVPLYSGYIPPKYRGVYYVDGGLTNNLPSGSETITVSPWSGGSDICPRDDSAISLLDLNIANTSVQMTVNNLCRLSSMLFPPEGEILSDFCRQGFREALRYLKEHGLFETVNPTPRSMSFSSELEDANTRRNLCQKLSMSSKWLAMQSSSKFHLEELEWEEDETDSEQSEGDYITIKIGQDSEDSSDEKIPNNGAKTTAGQTNCDSFDSNHNWDNVSIAVGSAVPHVTNNPLLSFLPIATVVEMPMSLEEFYKTLHMNLPHDVVQALEESYLNTNSSWHSALAKIVSICEKPLLLAHISMEKSYSVALFILKNAALVPYHLKWLVSYLSSIVNALHWHFQSRGSQLIWKLQNAKDGLSGYTKLLFCQLCVICQIFLQKLLSGSKTLDFSWVLKLTKSSNSFSKLTSYLNI